MRRKPFPWSRLFMTLPFQQNKSRPRSYLFPGWYLESAGPQKREKTSSYLRHVNNNNNSRVRNPLQRHNQNKTHSCNLSFLLTFTSNIVLPRSLPSINFFRLSISNNFLFSPPHLNEIMKMFFCILTCILLHTGFATNW